MRVNESGRSMIEMLGVLAIIGVLSVGGIAGTMYGVFHGEDIGEIVKILGQVNVLWLIPGVICVVVLF